MYTSIVEYSLIGAAVMFILWRNIGYVGQDTTYVKRKQRIRVNCSKTTTGLFLGLFYLAATFTSMAVYYGYTAINKDDLAARVYGITDIVQYSVSGLACVFALWRVRVLQEKAEDGNGPKRTSSAELLDRILLCIGMSGELIYSVAGLVGLTAETQWQSLSFILLLVHLLRLMQTGIQSFFIFIARRLKSHGNESLKNSQPGKQTVTFLLVANISMFLMNLFEAEKAGVSAAVVNFYGRRSWVFLVRSFTPLTIFYRFHSSACLAEIWKNTYSSKS